MQKKVLFALAIIIFAVIGIADASYITYEKLSGIIPPCSPGFQCEKVLTSAWSSIGPIPLSLLGIFFYSTMLGLGLLNYFEVRELRLGKFVISLQLLLALLGIFGLLFSAYLVFIMGVVIQGWCLYCLISAANCATLFALTNAQFFLLKEKQA